MLRRASSRLGRVPSLLYLGAYILMIFVFSSIYFRLPDRSFYHSTSQYEYEEFNAEAEGLLEELESGVRRNLVSHYGTEQPQIGGWTLETGALHASSLSVREFPHNFSFKLFAPLSMLVPEKGRAETQLRRAVTVPLQRKMIAGDVVYFFLDPRVSSSPPLPGLPAEPALRDLLPHVDAPGTFAGPVLAIPLSLYNRIVGFGQGYRGFPRKVRGHYLRMLYFSAGLSTASALGDIVPVASTARLLVTVQAVLSLSIVGLFLNALAVDIGNRRKRDGRPG